MIAASKNSSNFQGYVETGVLGQQPLSPSQEKNRKNWVKVVIMEVFFLPRVSLRTQPPRKG